MDCFIGEQGAAQSHTNINAGVARQRALRPDKEQPH